MNFKICSSKWYGYELRRNEAVPILKAKGINARCARPMAAPILEGKTYGWEMRRNEAAPILKGRL